MVLGQTVPVCPTVPKYNPTFYNAAEDVTRTCSLNDLYMRRQNLDPGSIGYSIESVNQSRKDRTQFDVVAFSEIRSEEFCSCLKNTEWNEARVSEEQKSTEFKKYMDDGRRLFQKGA
jgi:hypothetical protein